MTLPVTACVLTIDVSGIPAPQGSKSYKGLRAGKPILVESSAKVAPWRAAVARAARAHMNVTGARLLYGPIELSAIFWLPRGKTVTRDLPTTYPDLSKLLRSTEDAMTGIVWHDDAQITDYGHMAKRYAESGKTGARIVVRELTEDCR